MDPHFDAESLAAFADGSLSRAERAAVEAHAADCPRCLQLLAAMARTDQAPVPHGRWRMPDGLRWAVPLAVGATALALWINAERRTSLESPQPARESVAVDAVRPQPPAPATPGPAEPEPPPASPSPVSPRSGAPPLAAVAKPVPPVLQERREQARSELPKAAPVLPRADAPAEEGARAAGARVAAAPRSPEVQQSADRFAGLTSRAVQGITVIDVVSPDPLRRWRVRGPVVERSTDGGTTWVPQPDVSGAQVLAGASPSGDVVWLVGRDGTVLLSPDGKLWQRLPFPQAVPLTGVRARSGQDADVTTADGRVFRSTDGGRTWSLQESPRPPF